MRQDRVEHAIEVLDRVNRNNLTFDLRIWRYCAMGWLCRDNYFQHLGLTFQHDYTYGPIFENHEGFGAAARLFGINYVQAHTIFSVVRYERYEHSPRTLDVIARLRYLLKTKGNATQDQLAKIYA